MLQQQLGAMQINRIIEYQSSEYVRTSFFPHTTPEDWPQHEQWMKPHAMDPETGNLTLVMQAYLIRTRHHNIIVDTCVGDYKPRPSRASWHMQARGTVPANLAAAGMRPEQVDYVFCTHMHVDHVGWNTRLQDGRWVPMFPNAKYIFARQELAYWEALPRDERTAHFVDSVLPIVEAGQAVLVDNDYALNDEVWLEPTPGHTPAHVSVRLSSNGAQAVITGDMIHSPVQCLEPEWVMRADTDAAQACQTRRAFLERYCDTDVLVCGSHFPAPSMGHIVARDKAFWFQFIGAAR
jgi:glyoxylase-like metal-dependent hydrolase (beta-lactamase superfamily II)